MVMESVYVGGSWVDKAVVVADRLAALDRQVTALQRCNTDYVTKNRALQARVDYLEGILAEAGKKREMFDPARLEANRVVHVEAMKLAAVREFVERTVPAWKRIDWDAFRAQERVRELTDILRHAHAWMLPDGCDCGTDEQGSCALCETERVLEIAERRAGRTI